MNLRELDNELTKKALGFEQEEADPRYKVLLVMLNDYTCQLKALNTAALRMVDKLNHIIRETKESYDDISHYAGINSLGELQSSGPSFDVLCGKVQLLKNTYNTSLKMLDLDESFLIA